MSIIVVVQKGEKAVIASDSQFGQGSLKTSANRANHHKIFRVKDAYVGFTGWSAMSIIFENIVEKYSEQLEFGSSADIFRTFLFLHSKLKEEYFLEPKEKDNQPVESSQWDCLIASPAGIFSIQSYREVMECKKFWAEGSGLELALGAMSVTFDLYDDPEQIALSGVTAASEFDKACGLPAQIYSVKIKKN